MKVIITGGGGFLGSRLCTKLVEVGKLTGPSGVAEPIEQVVLLDSTFPDLEIAPLVSRQVCDIADRDAVFEAVGLDGNIAVFHLASMMTHCESTSMEVATFLKPFDALPTQRATQTDCRDSFLQVASRASVETWSWTVSQILPSSCQEQRMV